MSVARSLPTSLLTIWSLILGLTGFCVPAAGIAAVICGHLGLSRIRNSGGTLGGRGVGIAGLVTGYLSAAMWITVVVAISLGATKMGEVFREMERQAGEPFALDEIAVPVFPGLPDFQVLEPSGVRVTQLDLPGDPEVPGSAMSLRVYLPAGEAAPGSLPCVLVAPAGTNLISGAGLDPLDEDAYHDETLPYAEAGMAVVLYSIDGEDPEMESDDEARADEMKEAYLAFQKAGAGTVNGRNAYRFVRHRLLMVDPNRIYSAGHSSAATLSLLMAAHEPGLAGALAYAPAVDIEERFSDLTGGLGVGLVFPGIEHFVKRSSPLTHAGRIPVPVFLFFAEDDDMVAPESAGPFIERVKAANPDVTLQTVPDGGHYQSMIDAGIPAGIRWIREREGGTAAPAGEPE